MTRQQAADLWLLGAEVEEIKMTEWTDCRRCWCGSEEPPQLVGSAHDPGQRGFYVICPTCGCRTISVGSVSRAWYAWDTYDLQKDEENMTIYDVMNPDCQWR